jgi:hypothetical protein
MFARVLEFVPKIDKRRELIQDVKNEILPILQKQNGFLDALPLFQFNADKAIAVSLWKEKRFAQAYEREWFPKIQEMVKPYLATPITVTNCVVETELCERLAEALLG